MARNLSTTLSDLDSAITAEHNAWAAFAGYAENAHLAAVMGPSLLRHLRMWIKFPNRRILGAAAGPSRGQPRRNRRTEETGTAEAKAQEGPNSID